MLKKVLKWIGIGLGGLVGLLVLAFVVLYIVGTVKINKKYKVPVESISIPTDPESIQRGEHIATIYICTSCHTESLSGELNFVAPGMVSISSPNLTSGIGGIGRDYTDEDWVRAIRHGVNRDGKAIFIMPSNAYYYMSDEDLGALIAYIKSLPPVDDTLPEKRIEPIGRLMMALGMFPPFPVDQIDHTNQPPAGPEPGVTVAYGEYLARTCKECHGENLNGKPFGPPGQEVPTPNLTPGGELGSWSEQDFFNTLRTGVTPNGRQLREDMPWKYFGKMSDDELKALWMYLRSLPALEQSG
jgi:mono/diheme cytochrome c family protein